MEGDTPITPGGAEEGLSPGDAGLGLSPGDAGLVRYLKTLVTALSVTMIGGVIVLVAVVVMRFQAETAPAVSEVVWPERLALPAGVRAEAVTRGPGYVLVVGSGGRVFVLSADGQVLRQELVLDSGM